MENLRIPPHSLEAEQALIAALIDRNSLLDDLEDTLAERYFYRAEHQVMYRTMCAMALQNQPIDPVTLADRLDASGLIEQAGGAEYVVELVTSGRGSSNAKHYAHMIRDRWVQRELIKRGQEIVELGFDSDDAYQALQDAQALVMDFEQSSDGTKTLNQQLSALLDKIDFLHRNRGKITGLETGYTDFDKRLSGLQKTNLIIIAGRPGQGKTTAAMNMAEHAATHGKNVLVFSLEMSADELLMRSACSVGHIDHGKLRDGNMDEEDWPRLTSAVSRIKGSGLHIDDRPVVSSEQLFSRSRKTVRTSGKPLDLIVVDYIQLLSDKGEELQRITNITRNLKLLAKSMNCPVVALSQLNRDCEKRPNKRPILSDLRSSGSIEQDADIITFVYRDEYYNEDTEQKGIAEFNIAKFRSGRTGTVFMASILNQCRFDNLVNYQPPEPAKTKGRKGFEYD